MRCKILHESKGRIRVHMHQCNMTVHEADKLLYYLEELDFVKKAEVNERTANAIIYYKGEREQVIEALSVFNYETTEVIVPEHTGRELRVQFEDKMFFLITRRLISKFILPPPIQMIKNVIQAVPFVIEGVKSILKGKVEVSVLDATSITVSIIRKDFETSGSVIFLLKVGELIENYTHRKSVDDLARKMSLNVDKVWIKTADEQEILVNTFDVKEGDVVVIRTGTMIPLDGIIESGEASINQASMTGESEAVRKDKGDLVYAGTVVEEGEIFVRVQKAQGAGRYDRIVAMIEESEKLKSATEDKASHLADRLVPYTLGSTLLTYLITRNATKAASILMVDFCCALKLSMPIAVLSAMRESGEYKISVKGGKFMEAVAEAETIVFDKTGTLTHAVPRVKRVIPFDGNDEAEMLRLAACLEEHYPHSIANAVVKTAEERGLFHEEKHTKAIYVVAHGIASTINGEKVCIGSHHYIFDDERCIVPPGETDKFDELPNEYSHLYMAIDNRLAAVILIEDPLREEAASVVEKLKKVGFSKVVMMTGDNERTARDVALKTGVTDYFSEKNTKQVVK